MSVLPIQLGSLADRFTSAQLAGDRRGAVDLLLQDGLGAGLEARELLEVIASAQRRIGELWASNRISVAQEHAATAIAQLALAHVYAHLRHAPPTGVTVVVACVEGEQHDLGARILADVLETEGFEVRFLGANVPTAHLLDYVRDLAPQAVFLSVFLAFNLPALDRAVERLRREVDRELIIAAGGPAVASASGAARPAALDFVAEDAATAITQLRELVPR